MLKLHSGLYCVKEEAEMWNGFIFYTIMGFRSLFYVYKNQLFCKIAI